METRGQPPSETPSQPVASHEKLRSLRDRAHAALAEQRQRMQSLEARLADQLEAVAAGLAEELADQAKLATAAENHASELAAAREAFDRDRADWEAEHAIAESQVHARWQELDARQAELDRRDEEAEAREQQLVQLQQALEQRDQQLAEQQRLLDEREQHLGPRWQELEEREAALAGKEEELARKGAAIDEGFRELDAARDELSTIEQTLHSAEEEVGVLRAELEAQRSELETQCSTHEAERIALAEQQQQLADRDESLQQRETDLAQKQEQFEAHLAATDDQRAAGAQELARRETELAEREAELKSEQGRLATEREALETFAQATRDAAEAHNEQDQQQVAELQAQLAQTEQAHREEIERLQAELAAAVASSEQVRSQLATQAEEHEGNDAQAARAAELEAELARDREAWRAEREKFIAERDRQSSQLRQLQLQLTEATPSEQQQREHEKLEEKFRLAVEDVHAMRQRVSELEQELSRRPDPEAGESAELIELRDQRDALEAQVEALQQQSATVSPEIDDQAFRDMERRFELAVEDVRELRSQNAALEEQLAAARIAAPVITDDGAMDWEAQKRRLLASLEGETEELTPSRVEDRTTIEGTIRITDQVVAEKDRQLAELEQQLRDLESQRHTPTAKDEIAAAINADEAIQAEREKLAALEQELDEKLRKAELELSVERAKIARERARMEELEIELASLRGNPAAKEGPDAGGGKGRGRWLSKLGLGGDET